MKRTKFSDKPKRDPNEKKVICEAAKTCWYQGTCPHRVPHYRSESNCEVSFCSLLNLKNCRCTEVE